MLLLEEELGDAVFLRLGRKVRLTAAGQSLVREARDGTLRVRRVLGVSMVRETGWVYVRGARVPRVVQEMFEALKRTMPRLKLAP